VEVDFSRSIEQLTPCDTSARALVQTRRCIRRGEGKDNFRAKCDLYGQVPTTSHRVSLVQDLTKSKPAEKADFVFAYGLPGPYARSERSAVSARQWFKGPEIQGSADELAAIERELSS
jgi:hypothetical protein